MPVAQRMVEIHPFGIPVYRTNGCLGQNGKYIEKTLLCVLFILSLIDVYYTIADEPNTMILFHGMSKHTNVIICSCTWLLLMICKT